MKLRPREPEKEIGPPSFRFNSHKSGLERVYDELTKRNSSMIDANEILDPSKLKKLRKPMTTNQYQNQQN